MLKKYDKGVNEVRKMTIAAKKQNVKSGTIISSKTGTKIKVTDEGAQWLSGNKQIQQMSVDEIIDVMYYKAYNKIPD